METLFGFIGMALIIAMFVFAFWSAKRSKPLGGFYKAINVCGRWYNFFMMDFLLAGVFGWIPYVSEIAGALNNPSGEPIGPGMVLLMVLQAAITMAVAFILGLVMYKRVYTKCPDDLKHRFLKDMLLIFFGTIYRVGFFIFMFVIRTWWEFSKPREYIVNGQTVYAFPGSRDLYSSNGIRVGIANDNMTEAVMDL